MVNSRNCNPQCGKVLTRCKISRCHKLFPFPWFSPTLQPAQPPSSMLSFSSSTLLYYISRSFGYRNIDDRHRNPYINIREIIWLGNQLTWTWWTWTTTRTTTRTTTTSTVTTRTTTRGQCNNVIVTLFNIIIINTMRTMTTMMRIYTLQCIA